MDPRRKCYKPKVEKVKLSRIVFYNLQAHMYPFLIFSGSLRPVMRGWEARGGHTTMSSETAWGGATVH